MQKKQTCKQLQYLVSSTVSFEPDQENASHLETEQTQTRNKLKQIQNYNIRNIKYNSQMLRQPRLKVASSRWQ